MRTYCQDVILEQPAMTAHGCCMGALEGVAPPCFVGLIATSRAGVPDADGVHIDIVVDESDDAPASRKPGP